MDSKYKSTRRGFIQSSAAGFALLPLAALAQIAAPDQGKRLKVVCVGGHPDDPETGCGGTLLKLRAAGHAVTVLYLTRGESGIKGKTHDEAAAIRTKEAVAACEILQAKPLFFGLIDGATVFDNAAISKMQQMLEAEKPDLVFTQWPIDSHRDHQVTGLLAIQAWMKATKRFELYFYEVCIGEQSMIFRPTDYVDISGVQPTKRKAIDCHVSQELGTLYSIDELGNHELMERFRGAEAGVHRAEAFIRMTGKENSSFA